MGERTYTLPELEKLWCEYIVTFACRWLVQGEWIWNRPPDKQVATRAERVKIADNDEHGKPLKTFIEFLKGKG